MSCDEAIAGAHYVEVMDLWMVEVEVGYSDWPAGALATVEPVDEESQKGAMDGVVAVGGSLDGVVGEALAVHDELSAGVEVVVVVAFVDGLE